jgi:glutamyl-tRNA synthetase
MNGRYMRSLGLPELTAALESFYGRDDLGPAAAISAEKLQTLADFWPLCGFIYDGPAEDPQARERWLDEQGRAVLSEAREALAQLEPFGVAEIEAALGEIVARRGLKPREVYQPLRVALAGKPVSPGIFETVAVLGREDTLRRIDAALNL